MKQLTGFFDIHKKCFINQSENVLSYEDEAYGVYLLGNITPADNMPPMEYVLSLYKEYGNSITEHLQGVYILVVYDRASGRLSIYHDRSTSPLTLYYSTKEGVIYYSTSIKKLLITSKISRQWNEEAIEDFLINGFLYGEDTLIAQVNKLKAFHCINVDDGGIKQVKVKYSVKPYTKEEALAGFNAVLEKAILRQIDDSDKEINMPLSSGYDSNFIINTIEKHTDLPINAFSVGGKTGRNELPIVKENIQYYPHASLFSTITDSESLQHFPDIVWRLEGNAFEAGLFLQYELNSMVNAHGKKSMICGECADQVMHESYFDELKNNGGDAFEHGKWYEFSEYPFAYGSYMILKKNGILANSFDIETKYPYLDYEFVSLCAPLGESNGKKKNVHKENCQKQLPKEVIANTSKIGGSTDCHSLFDNKEQMNELVRFVEGRAFYKSHRKIIKNNSYEEKNKPKGWIALKTFVRNKLYKALRKEIPSPDYYSEEMKLRESLIVAYLILFEDLFISGKYDNEMKKEGIDYTLQRFMK